MDDLIKALAGVLGGGVVLTALAAGILYVTKEAIAKAVTHAGNRELERLKADLAKEAEKEKQAFTRELERERQAFTRELEQFKAGLTLEAEVRRQVAARKVDVIGKILAQGDSIVRRAGDADLIQDLNAINVLLQTNKHLFSAAVAKKFAEYVTRTTLHDHDVKHDFKAQHFKDMTKATEDVIALARAELHVEELS